MFCRDIPKLKKLFTVMLPILASQLAIMGMQTFDVAMSGHAGAEELAGSSVGSSIIMPIIGATIGFLMSATPILAQLIGKKEYHSIGSVIKTGLILATAIEFFLLLIYILFIDLILGLFSLTDYVNHVARFYILAIILGMGFGLFTFPLRSLVETVTSTSVAMRIYLLALPINALLNYCFIFGHFGCPALGGIGAGVATALTYFIIFLIFAVVLRYHPKLKKLHIFQGKLQKSNFREYISLGIPNALSIFMESSIFGFILIFVSKFGTAYTAAHQVAMNVAGICYMIPLSFSLALTIIIGIEVGAGRLADAQRYIRLSLQVSFLTSCLLSLIAYFSQDYIAQLYADNTVLLELIPQFLIYVIIWQIFDSYATPVLGILRGYKDVKIPFYINMIAYWIICFPVGIYLDLIWHHGAFSYWQSLVLGIFASGFFLAFRMKRIQKKYKPLRLGEDDK